MPQERQAECLWLFPLTRHKKKRGVKRHNLGRFHIETFKCRKTYSGSAEREWCLAGKTLGNPARRSRIREAKH